MPKILILFSNYEDVSECFLGKRKIIHFFWTVSIEDYRGYVNNMHFKSHHFPLLSSLLAFDSVNKKLRTPRYFQVIYWHAMSLAN